MAIYSKNNISPIQVRPPPKKGKGDSDGDGSDKGKGEGGYPGGDKGEWDEDKGEWEWDEDDKLKEIEDMLSQREDLSDEEYKNRVSQTPSARVKSVKQELRPVETQSVTPAYSWKELIKQFVNTAGPLDTTYTKPNPRAATQISIAQQIGAAAIKPGEKPSEDAFKLLMVFDSSGSMAPYISLALTETQKLLKMSQTSLDPILGVVYFSGSPAYYAANTKTKQAWQIDNFNDIGKNPGSKQKISLQTLLSSALNPGATVFSSGLSDQLASMARKDYNVLLISDSDLLYGDNWNNFVNLYKANPRKIFFIANDADTYKELINKMKVKPRTFGHF
jgi:hypothetical protein